METILPESITTTFDVGDICHHYDSNCEFLEIILEPRNTYLVDKEHKVVLYGKNCRSMANFKGSEKGIKYRGSQWFSQNVAKIILSKGTKTKSDKSFPGNLNLDSRKRISIEYELDKNLYENLIGNLNNKNPPHLVTLSIQSVKWESEIYDGYDIDLSKFDSNQGIKVHGIKFERDFPAVNAPHEEYKHVASTVAKSIVMLLTCSLLIEITAVIIQIFRS
jgi:hypothetical protein